MNDSTLRDRARMLMKSGELPIRLPDRMWGGPGAGSPCTVCEAPIKRDETEVEIEWSESSSVRSQHLHPSCFIALQVEITEGQPAWRTVAASGQASGPMESILSSQPN